MMYFDRSHTLYGAALCIPIGRRTAEKWNAELMEIVEQEIDLP